MSNRKIKNSSFAKAVAGFTGIAMAVMMLGGAAIAPAQAATIDELAATIAQLTATIAGLQSQLVALQGGSTGTATCSYTFATNLSLGDNGALNVQKFLNLDSATQVASSGIGSAGNETDYFGGLTKAAVIKFQDKYASDILTPVGLSAGTGYWGPSSRAKANAICTDTISGGTTTSGGTTVGGGLTVSAATQPADSLAPFNAARVPFTAFTLINSGTADATVTGVTVERTGLASDVNFKGVALLDGDGNQIGLTKTLNSNHQATIGGTFTVPAGTSKTYTVAGNMAAAATVNAGEVASFKVASINTSSTLSGSLPITGASHTVNGTLAIGSVTIARGPLDPNGAQTKEVGTTAYTFSSAKVTVGSAEKAVFHSIRWNQSGSAASGDLANVTVYVDGTAYTPVVSSDGKYYTANLGGIVIDKGASVEISIKGDIVSGSGRTIAFDLYRTTDLNVSGNNFGYGITPPTSGTSGLFGTTNPWYNASVVTVSGGSLTVSKATSVTSQNIAVNLANQPLGGFDVDVKGEPVSVASMVFTVASTTGSGQGLLTDVSLVDPNGAVVAGPVDGVYVGTLTQSVTFTDTVTFPVAKGTYTLKGKVATGINSNGTYITSFIPSTAWTSVTGQTTGNSITAGPTSTVTGNTMTVKAAAVTINVSNSPAAQTVVAGAQQFVFANYQFDATASGEGIRFNALPLAYDFGGTTGVATSLTACTLYDGATALQTGSNVVNPTAAASSTTFTLDTGLTIAKGTVKTLPLKCNIAAGATGTYYWGYDSGASPTATGVTSGQSASITGNDSIGQIMTLTTGGTLTVTLDASSPSYALAAAGTTENILAILKFHAANEAIDLKKVALQLTNTASSSSSSLSQVTLWDGSTPVGTATFIGSNTNATSTLTSNVTISKDGDKLITVKGDLSAIGTSQVGVQGHLVAVDYDGDDSTGTSGTGVASGATRNQSSSSDTASSGVRMFKSIPTIAKIAVPTNVLSNGEKSLLRFKVTADSKGDVGILKFTARIATTTATVSSPNIYAYTDSGFSSAVTGLSSDAGMLATDLVLSTVWASSATDLEFYAQTSAGATTTIQVPAGGTRYFDVRATVAGSASGASVSTQLQGDAAYPQLADPMGTEVTVDGDAGSNDDFIWSPNATTSSPIIYRDWTNGYGVSGLPGSNMTAEVVSQ